MSRFTVGTLIGGQHVARGVLSSGTEIQFVAMPSSVLMGVRPAGSDQWSNTVVSEPERFGKWATRDDLKRWVAAYEEAAQ